MDCFLKARALGELPPRRYFLAVVPSQVANAHLLAYWKRRLPVLSGVAASCVVRAMSRWLFLRQDVSHYVLRLNATADAYRIAAEWSERAPLLTLTDEDEAWGARMLRDLGVPGGSWFVAVHVRDKGYSPADEAVHAHRNASIDAITDAVRLIVERGGWCIRVGDSGGAPAPNLHGLIDYARHPLKSDRMDIYLCARSRFFLGNSSGLAFVSAAFGVPSALVNLIPASTLGLLPRDLGIPKLMRSMRDGSYLKIDDVLGSPLSNFRYAKLYQDAGVRPVENDAEDIRALVNEMLDRLEGRFAGCDEDEALQRTYKSLLRQGHYSYGSPARVGAAFLRRYRSLLPAAR